MAEGLCEKLAGRRTKVATLNEAKTREEFIPSQARGLKFSLAEFQARFAGADSTERLARASPEDCGADLSAAVPNCDQPQADSVLEVGVEGFMDPRDILFTHSSISRCFRNGAVVDDTGKVFVHEKWRPVGSDTKQILFPSGSKKRRTTRDGLLQVRSAVDRAQSAHQ